MCKRARAWIVFLALLAGTATAQAPAEFKVIVNTSNSLDSISARDLSRLFLKKDLEWPDGTPVDLVDLDPDSPTREAFSEAIHGRNVASIKSYWQRQIFAGKAVPPLERSNQAEVLVYVSRHPNAVAYITASAPMIDNVKVLRITD
jgi:hypothetical protein